ncbi:hypothetical protein Y032_0176g544 [Ancylostoma ceylanicum]|uniref:Uncharacterized protein n=1 Tax=Ancylostoma ceylanicum TaxID=53326 RepID=A0A016SUJ3_9BILA|nr:hypothetical protein Y032_0176g544 [Ancylostoma ceylanicum]
MFKRISAKRAGLTLVICTFLCAGVSWIDIGLHFKRLESTPHEKHTQKDCSDNFCTSEECLRDGSKVVSDRWIVMTTKHHRIKPYNKVTSRGWQLVVVGDDTNLRDRHVDGVHFINDKESDFTGRTRTAKKSTSRMYSGKNAGYLYAIKNGARYIYDADENITLDEEGLEGFDYDKAASGLWYYVHNETKIRSERIFNPYQFFGSTNNGTGEILLHFQNHTNAGNRLRLCRKRSSAPVQHGMVRGEFGRSPSDSDVGFNKFAPHVSLAPGSFSMFFSSNTLFHYRAFFALFVPVSATSRRGMVLRSYFIQKLLHLIGDGIGFYPPNSMFLPNEDNNEGEYVKQRETLPSAHEMAELLESWKCSNTSVVVCSLSLAKEFSKRRFWSERDVIAVEAWNRELEQLGTLVGGQ